MTDAPAPDVAIVEVNYLGAPSVIDQESDAIVPSFPLTLISNLPSSPYFTAFTNEVPSPLTIPQAPSNIDFFTFDAFAPLGAGEVHLVSILGAPEFDQNSFAATSGLAIIWRNYDSDPDHNIVGGDFTLTSVPEPSVVIVALLVGMMCLRGRPGALPCVLALLTVVGAALNVPAAARAQAIIDSNPPQGNPWCDTCPVFRDVLQAGAGTELTQGIGGAATPALGGVGYAVVTVTFDTPPVPSPASDNVTVNCEVMGAAATAADCPNVTGVEVPPERANSARSNDDPFIRRNSSDLGVRMHPG